MLSCMDCEIYKAQKIKIIIDVIWELFVKIHRNIRDMLFKQFKFIIIFFLFCKSN